jgi:CRISPR/Cas system-associated protein Csm6
MDEQTEPHTPAQLAGFAEAWDLETIREDPEATLNLIRRLGEVVDAAKGEQTEKLLTEARAALRAAGQEKLADRLDLTEKRIGIALSRNLAGISIEPLTPEERRSARALMHLYLKITET